MELGIGIALGTYISVLLFSLYHYKAHGAKWAIKTAILFTGYFMLMWFLRRGFTVARIAYGTCYGTEYGIRVENYRMAVLVLGYAVGLALALAIDYRFVARIRAWWFRHPCRALVYALLLSPMILGDYANVHMLMRHPFQFALSYCAPIYVVLLLAVLSPSAWLWALSFGYRYFPLSWGTFLIISFACGGVVWLFRRNKTTRIEDSWCTDRNVSPTERLRQLNPRLPAYVITLSILLLSYIGNKVTADKMELDTCVHGRRLSRIETDIRVTECNRGIFTSYLGVVDEFLWYVMTEPYWQRSRAEIVAEMTRKRMAILLHVLRWRPSRASAPIPTATWEECHRTTMLHVFAQQGELDMMKLVLEIGVDPTIRDSCGETPLHHAGTPQAAKVLLAAGADVNEISPTGSTPLHTAATFNRHDVARTLLEHGANPWAHDSWRNRPLVRELLVKGKKYPEPTWWPSVHGDWFALLLRDIERFDDDIEPEILEEIIVEVDGGVVAPLTIPGLDQEEMAEIAQDSYTGMEMNYILAKGTFPLLRREDWADWQEWIAWTQAESPTDPNASAVTVSIAELDDD